MLFNRSQIASQLKELAEENGIYIGTTSWKFPGWCGVLYDEDRYLWGTHFSKARFNRDCLEEYADVFRTVCVDATYYRLPKKGYCEELAASVPDGFRFSFKVPDDITIKNYPDVKAFGRRRGRENRYFLDPGLFRMGFLRRLEEIRPKVGMLIFEFSHFHASDFEHGRDFVSALDRFFAKIPPNWQYGVEVRNANLLHSEYFEMLESRGVAHIYNHWTQMPPVGEQTRLYPINRDVFVGARYLLTPHRSRDWAERELAPYNQLKEIDPDARESMRQIINGLKSRGGSATASLPSYIYVGNQLEGNALHTISDVLGMDA